MELWGLDSHFWAAIFGAGVGGGFALAGAWHQARHARKLADQHRRDRQREGWFDDLRRVYEQVGRHYAGITAACAAYVRTKAETVRVPDHAENLHAQMLLHMHGVAPEVLAASERFFAVDREILDLPAGAATWHHYDRLVDALGEFYGACGTHLDDVWPTGHDDDTDST